MNSPKHGSRGLDRGLDALLSATQPRPATTSGESYGENNVFNCPLDKIVPQKGQPRQRIDDERLNELAQSIREHGVLEPLVVRRIAQDQFELIAGERRWRALIENVQREVLDPIEFAEALDRLIKEHGYTQETLAGRVGKDRSTIANALRLLRLPASVRTKVVEGQLSEGHARALLGRTKAR